MRGSRRRDGTGTTCRRCPAANRRTLIQNATCSARYPPIVSSATSTTSAPLARAIALSIGDASRSISMPYSPARTHVTSSGVPSGADPRTEDTPVPGSAA